MKRAIESILILVLLATSLWSEDAKISSASSDESDHSTKTRKELWEKKRIKKLESVVPEETSGIQKYLLWVEKRRVNLEYKGFYGEIANFPTGSGFAPQIRYWEPSMFGSPIDLQLTAAYSTRGYQRYTFRLGRILKLGTEALLGVGGSGGLSSFRGLSRRENDFFLYADILYFNYPQEDFFGVGPDSSEDDRTNFRMERVQLEGVMGVRLSQWAILALRAGYIDVNTGRGTDSRFPSVEELFNDEEAPGLDQQPDYVHISPSIVIDYRDQPGNPHSGGMYGFRFTRFDDQELEAFNFNRYTIDLRQYFSLGSVQRVLALWFLTSMDVADSGSRVPFYAMETLGGSETLRGFREFRFRDENRLYLSAEYRWEAAPAWEFALFYDAGKVFSDRSDFNLEDLEDNWGFGTRFKFHTGVFMRFDIARSNEGTRFYWKFSGVF